MTDCHAIFAFWQRPGTSENSNDVCRSWNAPRRIGVVRVAPARVRSVAPPDFTAERSIADWIVWKSGPQVGDCQRRGNGRDHSKRSASADQRLSADGRQRMAVIHCDSLPVPRPGDGAPDVIEIDVQRIAYSTVRQLVVYFSVVDASQPWLDRHHSLFATH